LAPLAVLLVKGASWSYPVKGMWWSLVAGIVGAVGAFGVLLAFGAISGWLVPVLWPMLILAHVTVIQRIYHVRKITGSGKLDVM
jgi:hypothetical protein